MPDVWVKGHGHTPVLTVAGHYLGMHAPERPEVFDPKSVWYRGDDYQLLMDLIESQGKRIAELEIQVANSKRPGPRREKPT